MKISKKKAIEFAAQEWIFRNGQWDTLEDEPDWTLEDEVEQDGLKGWINNPKHMIATMMFDGLFRDYTKKDLAWARKYYGAKLWQEAMEAYVTGDHDT